MISSLISKLRQLNFFHSKGDSNENIHQHRSNIIITRVYLALLILILLSVSFGLWLTLIRTTITIHYPTKDEFEKLPTTAECPCSRLSFSYGTFITLQPIFHQVCSSDFVTNRWIETMFSNLNTSLYYKSDIRTTGSAHFQTLTSLCRLSEKSVSNSLLSFYSTSFISSKVLYQDYLKSITEASIEHFRLTVPFIFQSQLQLINDMMFGNQLVSALQSTFYLGKPISTTQSLTSLIYYHWEYKTENGSICMCNFNFNCREILGIYSQDIDYTTYRLTAPILLFKIPGLWAGCTTIHSLLQSTLECFYNQTCLNMILSYLSIQEMFTAMSINEKTKFQSNTTIQSIVDDIMVEEWIYNISYEKYFDQCQPLTCTYSKLTRRNLIDIITKIIGLLGGLTMILGIIIPLLVRFIRNRKLPKNQPQIPLSIKIRQLIKNCRQSLIELNLFDNQSQNVSFVRYQRITTRIYIIILIKALVILTLYLSLKKEIYYQTINKPTVFEYTYLKEIHSTSLTCPCTHLTVSHEKFLTIKPKFHQICSSSFISTKWTDMMSEIWLLYSGYTSYRINPSTYFFILATFCKYAEQTVNGALDVFYQTQLISSQVINQQIFNSQIDSLIDDWKLNTINSFQRSIQLIRETNQGNKLINDMFNINHYVNISTGEVIVQALTYSNCSCDLFGSCQIPTASYKPSIGIQIYAPQFRIRYFFVGCFPIEALLQSKLTCFYDQACLGSILDTTAQFLNLNLSTDFSTLSMFNYDINETIESIVNQLMVKTWINSVSFSSYYNACAPASCTYEYTNRSQLLIIILAVIGILGGLSTGLKILILILIRLIENLIQIRTISSIIQLMKNIFICDNEQKLTNRLHFLLLMIIFIILYLISFLNQQIITVDVSKPSFIVYEKLFKKYSQSLECSCSDISFQYGTFLTIKANFHPICSTNFMSNEWIMYIYKKDKHSLGQFQLLISLCQLSNKTINDTFSQFIASDYINSQLQSSTTLNEQIQLTIDDFKLRASQSFLSIVNLIREMTSVNMLMNMYSSNWKYQSVKIINGRDYAHTEPVVYEECNCGISSKCSQASKYMMIGCYPLESLLQSTLQCFYDQQCIDASNTFKALNSSSLISSHFNINSTVELILEELMLEKYPINISYEQYFNECSPSLCSYSYSGYGDIIDIITSLIGLYGGLLIISRWFTLLIVKLYQYEKRRRHIIPSIQ